MARELRAVDRAAVEAGCDVTACGAAVGLPGVAGLAISSTKHHPFRGRHQLMTGPFLIGGIREGLDNYAGKPG